MARRLPAARGSATLDRALADLDVRLDAPLPADLAIGRGTAVFVSGTCFSPGARIATLALDVDGEEQPVMAHGMPRLETLRALGTPESYASGFWGIARIPASGRAAHELRLRARFEGGGEAVAELARIPARAPAEPVTAQATVAICMTTCNPPLELFRRQVDSIRAQTYDDWVCVVSDDCSDPERFAALQEVLGADPRFVVSRSARRLGFYRNFERALELAPAGAAYVALADQDDRWHPDKLATLLAELGGARLVYSDARVVTGDGRVLADTYWSRRDNNHSSLLSLLVANAVTGAASLFPAALLEDALPFPPAQFAHFHDHWLGLVALSLGDIAFVERPLYDYVQHGEATLGHAAANRMPGMRERVGALRRDPHERVRMWRMHYYVDACRLLQFAAVLRLRIGDRMPPDKRRDLDRFERADRSLAPIAGLAWRGAQELLGRRRDTLGAEWMLFHAFAWRRMLAASARDRPTRRLRLDALPPPTLDPRPGARQPAEPAARAVAEKIAPLRLAERDDAPRRVNLLIPSIDLEHFFGGYIGKFNFARRLAARGVRVRIVTVDPVGSLPASWREDVEAYSGLARAAGRGRGRVRARVPGPRGLARRHLRRDDLVDRPHRARGAAHARRAALPLPDPGVRAVHVPDGHPRRAGGRVLPLPARRAVLHRAAARLLPPPRRSASTRRGRRPATATRRRSTTRSRRSTRRARTSWPAGIRAGCCSTPGRSRTPPATCSSSACWRSAGRSSAARSRTAGPCTASGRSAPGGGWTSAAARCWSCSRARPRPPTGSGCASTTSASR